MIKTKRQRKVNYKSIARVQRERERKRERERERD